VKHALLLAIAVLLFAGCDADEAKKSHAFAQAAKRDCAAASSKISAATGAREQARELRHVRAQLASLRQPPNTHRAIARVLHDWDAAAATLDRLAAAPKGQARALKKELAKERHQATLAAHLLNVTACMDVVPKP
jgi:hypothetical protein